MIGGILGTVSLGKDSSNESTLKGGDHDPEFYPFLDSCVLEYWNRTWAVKDDMKREHKMDKIRY